jgi:predicted dienelactone hydrolase
MLRLLLLLLAATPAAAATCEATLRDPGRGRSFPVRLTVPDNDEPLVPLIVWSPGLGGGLAQGRLYANAWAEAGLATLQFAHPGSDAAVYREADARAKAAPTEEAGRAARTARIREATSSEQIGARLGDIDYAVSQLPYGLGRCRTERIDQSRLAVAGHSMGAWVAQILAGQRISTSMPSRQPFKAALAIAGSPLAGPDTRAASAADMTRPFMLVTGSLDGISPSATPEAARAQLDERAGLWPHLPAGGKYLYIAAGADHMQLAGTSVRATSPALAARLVPLLTAFWVETLKDGPEIESPALAAGDVFETR